MNAAGLQTCAIVALLCIVTCAMSAETPNELLLCKFQHDTELKSWQAAASAATLKVEPRTPQDPDYKLKVIHGNDGYPGICVPKPPADWSRYEVFSFEVWSLVSASVELRIDDQKSKGYNTRFNYPFKITKGCNLVQVPIAQIKKAVDVTQIKLVSLFMHKPPLDFVLYYDRFRLGPKEKEEVAFIPYNERADPQPTLAVRTPHFAMGRDLAGGPIKTFAIASITQGRDVVELMQRLDTEMSVVTWDRLGDANAWGNGDCYDGRGAKDDVSLCQRYFASSILGPEKFEALVMNTPWGWSFFPEAAREKVVSRVEQDGAGIVLIMPFPGGAKPEWSDELRKVCALVDSPSDYLGGGYYPIHRANSGILKSKKWRAVGAHPITDGVPLEALPYEDMQVMECKVAEGAQVLIETEEGAPVLAVKQLGKGRVLTFSFRSDSLTPPMGVNASDRLRKYPHRYWEVWYHLLARAVHWSAGREFKREGQPVVLEPNGEDADDYLQLKQWKNAEGKVTDWQLDFTPPPPDKKIIVLKTPEMLERGKPLELSFLIPKELTQAVWHLTAAEPSIASKRIIEALDLDLAGAHATKNGWCAVSLPATRFSGTAVHLHLTARLERRVVAEANAAVVFAPTQIWDDFEIHCWGGSGLPFLASLETRLEKHLGVTCRQTTEQSGMRNALVNGFRNQFFAGIHGLNTDGIASLERAYNRSKNPELLVRKPSFADPEEMARRHKEALAKVSKLNKFKPLSGIIADETSLTSYTAAFDYDFHPANIDAFRKKLEARFKTFEAMSTALRGAHIPKPELLRPNEATEELLLCKFHRETELKPWQALATGTTLSVEPLSPDETDCKLKVVHGGTGYPGIVLPNPPKDWSPYDSFAFDVWSAEDATAELRLDDHNSKGYDSRLNRLLRLKKGRNLIQIPVIQIRESIDDRSIKFVLIFMAKPPAGFTLHYDNFRLCPREKKELKVPDSFATIMPPTTAEARELGNWGLWNEWRAHNDDLWTDTFMAYANWFNEACPGIRFSVSGTQGSAPFNGVDWAKLGKTLRSVVGYRGRFQDLQRINFHPSGDLKSLSWVGYSGKGLGAHHQMWENLLGGDSGCAVFWWYSMRRPDLSWSQSAKDYKAVFDVIRRGVGRQFQLTRRAFSPTAVLWSATSQRAAYALGKYDEFVKAEAEVVTLLRKAGFDPYFISEEQLIAGELKSKGAQAVFLPATLSLGMGTQPGGIKVWPALKEFLDAKGLVVTSAAPQCDEFLQPLTPPKQFSEQAVSLSELKADFKAELARRGVTPKVIVQGEETVLERLRTYVHELSCGPKRAHIVSFLRPVPNSKQTVGADGVPRMEAAVDAGKPVACSADCSRLDFAACYDQRSGKRIDLVNGIVALEITAAQPRILTFLPYEVRAVTAQLTTIDRGLSVSWKVERIAKAGAENEPFAPHVVRLDVIDADSGELNLDLSRNLTSELNGQGQVDIALALSESEKRWDVLLTDVLTGMRVKAKRK